MFERNIIDLVGLFVENVQSLYPFLHKVAGGAAGPRARPRLQLNEGREGEPFSTDPQDAHEWSSLPGGTSSATDSCQREKSGPLAVYQKSTCRLSDRKVCTSKTLSVHHRNLLGGTLPLGNWRKVRPSDFHQGQKLPSQDGAVAHGVLSVPWSERCPQLCSSSCSRVAVEVWEGYSQMSDHTPGPLLPVLQVDTPRGRDNLQVADADKLFTMSWAD